jgi:hypothetical protein
MMDTIFIWLIAGATIGLLGIFLVASERELKSKRQELQDLRNKLTDVPVRESFPASADAHPGEDGTSAELVAKNEQLLQEVSSLSKKLEGSEGQLEQLETLRSHLNGKESEITDLRWDRERLQSEIATLKARPESDAPRSSEPNSNSEKEAEITALKEQLEANQVKIRDLEKARENLTDIESRETAFEERRNGLEANNLHLQNELASEREKNQALEANRMQLSEIEQRYQELSEANIRLQEENSQLQQHLRQNHFHEERWFTLRQRLEGLQARQAEVSEQERVIQEEILAISQLLDVVPEYVPEPESPNSIHYTRNSVLELTPNERLDMQNRDTIERGSFETAGSDIHLSSVDKTNGFSSEVQHQNSTDLTTAVAAANQASRELSRPGLKTKKRRFGIFSAALGVLAVSGVLAASFLSKDSEHKPSIAQLPPPASNKQPAGFEIASNRLSSATTASATSAYKPVPENQDNSFPHTSPLDSRSTKTSEKTTGAIASQKPLSTTWESYEIVRPTRVFSSPSEHSQLIANIEPGTQVNVVDSRNGWLEIRSKHGRPPGFIPKAAATRIGQN